MEYNLGKYRDKREKVLGVKKRGISFGTLAMVVAGVILFGLGAIVIPKSIANWQSRNLDDAIYKIVGQANVNSETIIDLVNVEGVDDVTVEADKGRVIVTFDKTVIGSDKLISLFEHGDLDVVLLNQMSHLHRASLMKKEAAFENQ